MALDPRQLGAFLAVVEHRSLGRAAAAFHLTQPALSRIIRRLETQLGVELFERHSTGMALTSYGEALLPYARTLDAGATQAVEEIQALRGLHTGSVRVGAVASATVQLLPGVIDRLLTRWPGLRVQIVEAVEDRLSAALMSNEIDLAIAAAIVEDDQIMRVADNEFQDVSTVVAAAAHPLHRQRRLAPRALLEQAWVLPPPDAAPRQQFEAQLAALGLPAPTVAVETRSPGAIKALVAKTRFLAWLPQPLFAAEEAAGLLKALPVNGLQQTRRFHVYRRRRHFTPPAVRKFLDELQPASTMRMPSG